MDDMNVILSLERYSIYKNDSYYLCIPNENCDFYHIFMGFSNKDLRNLNDENLFKEIRKISDSISAVYKNGIYVLPIISPKQFMEAANENDDRLYNKILNNIIQPVTFDVYKIIASNNLRVSQTVKMIKQNDVDKKFIGWLSLKLGNTYIKEITFENDNKQISASKVIEIETVTHNDSAIFVDYDIERIKKTKSEDYISDSLKPAVSPGFGSLGFIIMILSIFIVLGSIITYMIIK